MRGGHGLQFHPDVSELLILLFADDIILISDTVQGIQRKINILLQISELLGLTVHTGKSKVVVFRNGGHLAAHEKWFIINTPLKVEVEYTYLSIVFSTRLRHTCTQNYLATRAKTAFIRIDKSLKNVPNISLNVFPNVFDTQIKPILLYGAEIWGMSSNTTAIENVHLLALKRFLNVPVLTPNVIVYGDTGRYELYIYSILSSMKYWCKILKMSGSRYVRKASNMMLIGNNANCWTNKIKEILYRFHLGEYWLSQNVGNEVSFLNTLKQPLMEASDLRWFEIVQTRERYHIYRNFKPCRYKELYLNVINFTIYRKCLSCFTMRVCCINSNQLRFANIQDINVCPLCMENEDG